MALALHCIEHRVDDGGSEAVHGDISAYQREVDDGCDSRGCRGRES
jgi:hypothetical protein